MITEYNGWNEWISPSSQRVDRSQNERVCQALSLSVSSIGHGVRKYTTFLNRLRIVGVIHLVADCIECLTQDLGRIVLVVFD